MECIQFLQDYKYSTDVIIITGECFILSEDGDWYISETMREEYRIWFNYTTVHQWFLSQGIVEIVDE
jgi:hypothetical protein